MSENLANQADLMEALRNLYGRGQRRVRGGTVAELLWLGVGIGAAGIGLIALARWIGRRK